MSIFSSQVGSTTYPVQGVNNFCHDTSHSNNGVMPLVLIAQLLLDHFVSQGVGTVCLTQELQNFMYHCPPTCNLACYCSFRSYKVLER